MPVSCKACRFGLPSSSKNKLATESISTGARNTHLALPSERQLNSLSYSDRLSLVATRNRHGCSLFEDGAQRAASNRLFSFSGSTGRSSNARGLHRRAMRGSIGCFDGAGFSIASAVLLSLRLLHF